MVFPEINAVEAFRCIYPESRILAVGRQVLDSSIELMKVFLNTLNSELYFGIQKTSVPEEVAHIIIRIDCEF